MKHNDPKLFKDTFWNNERVKRNLKLGDISKYLNVPYPTVGSWFCGKFIPKEIIISKLCDWFSELLPDNPISFEDGERHFKVDHLTWQAEHNPTLKAHGTNQDTNKDIHGGRQPKSRIAFLIRSRGLSQKDLAEKLDIKLTTLQSYLRGQTKATTDLIIELSDILDNTPENIEEMLTEIYNKNHINPKQITTDDIQMGIGGFTADIPIAHGVTDQDITEMFPSNGLTVEHTMDEKESETDVDQDAKNRLRFVKWFDMFISTPLYKRIDIIAHLMHLYVEWDYDMWDAVEALAEEDRSIPFHILRTIILECRRVDYFGERDVKQNG